MGQLRERFVALKDEISPSGSHAGEPIVRKILHITRGVALICIDVLGKVDDQNRDADLRELTSELDLFLQDMASLIKKPAVSMVLKVFGSTAIESTLQVLTQYTGSVDDWAREYVMPYVHEARVMVDELDDALTDAFEVQP